MPPRPPSRIVTLKLARVHLAKYASDISSPAQSKDASAIKNEPGSTPSINRSENTTPMPNADEQPRRRGIPGPKPGSKRGAPVDADAPPKPKGKPGPKRRKVDGENGSVAPSAPAQKLGPKANTGAINAHLRALDRSGKPCRRWNRKGIALKTFTGVAWDLPYWSSPKTKGMPLDGEAQSETTGSSDAKNEQASSAVGSENDKDGLAGANGLPDMAASSPAVGAGSPL